jgi:hypothetical protein
MSSLYKRPPTSDELYHYGVIGMKWGIRRYQNADGTLTEAGKRHYNREANRAVKKERKSAVKNRYTMSDKEIQDRINRMNLEKRMKDLTDDDLTPGKTAVKNAFSKAGKVVMTAAIVGALAYGGKLAIQNKVPARAVKALIKVAKKTATNRTRRRVNEIVGRDSNELMKIGKRVFTEQDVDKFFDKINWDEFAKYAFPNPVKKK